MVEIKLSIKVSLTTDSMTLQDTVVRETGPQFLNSFLSFLKDWGYISLFLSFITGTCPPAIDLVKSSPMLVSD
jgi:hypothetical protein